MLAQPSRLPLRVDPLIAEVKRRAGRRHALLSAVAVLVAVCAVAGWLALRPSGGVSGAGRTTTTKVFTLGNPLYPNFYLQLHGSSALVNALAQSLGRTEDLGGLVAVSMPHGKEDCSVSRKITRKDVPSLQRFAGQTATIRLFGSSGFAQLWCNELENGLLLAR